MNDKRGKKKNRPLPKPLLFFIYLLSISKMSPNPVVLNFHYRNQDNKVNGVNNLFRLVT